jgi:hypothetical protein
VFADGARPSRLVYGDRNAEDDSGWQVAAGDESRAYLDDADNARWITLADLVYAWPDLDAVFGRSDHGAFVWDDRAHRYHHRPSGD